MIASGIYNNVYLQREGDPYYPQASISGTTTVLGYFYMTTGTIFNVGSSDFTVAGQTTLEAGTTVTSTSGTMSFGAVTSTANIGSSSGNMVFGNFMNNGVLRLANTGTATTTGNVTSTGYILLGAGGVLSAMGDLDLRSSVLERGTGTVRFAGSANQDVRPSAHATANFTYFHHLSSIKNGGTVTLTHSGNTTTVLGDLTSTNAAASTLDTGSVHLSVVGGTTIGASGTVTSTNGALRFLGAASSTGSIGTSSGNIFFGDTYQNNGVIDIGSGYATSTGALTNYGTIYGRTGTYTILDSTASISGASLVPGTGTVVYAGTSQLIRSYVYYNLLIRGTAQLSGVSATSTVVNTLTVPSGGSFGVTNSGSDGSVRMTIGSISNAGTFTLAGTAAASVTTTGAVVNTGTLDVGNGILNIGTTLTNSGTFTKGTSIVRYLSNSSISIPGLEYYQLGFLGTGTYTLAASTTASATTTIGAGATLAIDTQTFNAPGPITNLGSMTTSTGGTIVHPVELVLFTDSSGTLLTSASSGDSIYVTVQDQGRNTNGTTQDTFTVPLTTNSAAGSDSETITLTETAVASGIFRNSSGVSVRSASVGTSNGYIDLTASGVGTATYTDTGDSTSTTMTLTYVAPASSGGSGGGGGGGIGGLGFILPGIIPSATTTIAPVIPRAPTPIPTSTPPIVPLPTPLPTPVPPPVPKVSGAPLLPDLTNREALLGHLGIVRDQAAEGRGLSGARSDAREFNVPLSDVQANRLALFVAYGVSPETRRLGEGERRALIRDMLETMQRADLSADDMQRLTIGEIPRMRNLAVERQQLPRIRQTFRTLYGHDPNFQNPQENLAWNTLMYRIRFPRNLALEQQGIREFQATFRRSPSSPFQWAAVRVQGYVQR